MSDNSPQIKSGNEPPQDWVEKLCGSFPKSYGDRLTPGSTKKKGVVSLSKDNIKKCITRARFGLVEEKQTQGVNQQKKQYLALQQIVPVKVQTLKDVLTFIGEKLNNLGHEVNPHPDNVFRALTLCPLEKVKLVIIGLDPQCTGQRNAAPTGVAFCSGQAEPSLSLRHLLRTFAKCEANVDPEIKKGDLSEWAGRGVLLLNTMLTCGPESCSHLFVGWQILICLILNLIAIQHNRSEAPVLILGDPGKLAIIPAFTKVEPPTNAQRKMKHNTSACLTASRHRLSVWSGSTKLNGYTSCGVTGLRFFTTWHPRHINSTDATEEKKEHFRGTISAFLKASGDFDWSLGKKADRGETPVSDDLVKKLQALNIGGGDSE